MNEHTIFHKVKGDVVIWTVFFFLCLISIIEVFSASSGLTYKTGSYLMPLFKHVGLLVLGAACMVVTMNIKCKYFKVFTPFVLPLSLILLILVLAVGESTNGAQRWLSLFGIPFQPSELAKGAVVLAVAQVLSAMQTENGADRRAFTYILIVSIVPVFLIALENLSTAALLFFVVMLMMFIGRVPKGQLGRMLGVLALGAMLGLAMIMMVGKDDDAAKTAVTGEPTTEMVDEVGAPRDSRRNVLGGVFHRFDTWKSRINKFLSNEEVAPGDYDLDKDAQVAHANIAIVSSNVIGKGPGNSVERDFLSQAFSDFIYAIIIEEMGILGAFFVCLLYIILLFRTATIANRCVNAFPALLIMGLALLLVVQAMFNMAVAVGLAPVTGQPLPLISKGGTSTVINCIYIGVILSVSHSAKKRDDDTSRSLSAVTS